MRLPLILAAVFLTACASTPPRTIITTVPVNVAVPVRCNPMIGPQPMYPDTTDALRSAPDIFERVKLILAGRDLRDAREIELSKALAGCEGGM